MIIIIIIKIMMIIIVIMIIGIMISIISEVGRIWLETSMRGFVSQKQLAVLNKKQLLGGDGFDTCFCTFCFHF